jgi:hypothetical protein
MRILFFFCFSFLCLTAEARMFFMHIPKTGGSSMEMLLRKNFPSIKTLPFLETLDYAKRGENAPSDYDLLQGHVRYSQYLVLDPIPEETFKFTILRDPVERYISHIKHHREVNFPHLTLEEVFEDVLDHPGFVSDVMCQYLTGDLGLTGESLLENAKKNLFNFDLVMFFEKYNEDAIILMERIGIQIETEQVPFINRTKEVVVSEKLREMVMQRNLKDQELYLFAKNHFWNK